MEDQGVFGKLEEVGNAGMTAWDEEERGCCEFGASEESEKARGNMASRVRAMWVTSPEWIVRMQMERRSAVRGRRRGF